MKLMLIVLACALALLSVTSTQGSKDTGQGSSDAEAAAPTPAELAEIRLSEQRARQRIAHQTSTAAAKKGKPQLALQPLPEIGESAAFYTPETNTVTFVFELDRRARSFVRLSSTDRIQAKLAAKAGPGRYRYRIESVVNRRSIGSDGQAPYEILACASDSRRCAHAYGRLTIPTR